MAAHPQGAETVDSRAQNVGLAARRHRGESEGLSDEIDDIAVIGAGAAGIAAARALSPRHSVVVLEARNRVGGRAWTYRKGNLALDLGCGWLHSADENEWGALAPTLGFPVDRMPPPWERPAHPANFSPGEREELLGPRLGALLCAHRRGGRAGQRAAHVGLLRAGRPLERLLGAMVTYINGAEAEELSVREYARYHDTEINRRVAQGYGTLIEAYAAPLDIRRECPATLIDHSGPRVRVVTPQGE